MIGAVQAIVAFAALSAGGCDDAPAPGDAGVDAGAGDSDVADADAGEVDAGPCPVEMVLVDDGDGSAFCVDRYEHPGVEGISPTTGVAWFEAAETCANEAKEVCTEAQWARACAGTPAERCAGDVGPAGRRPECVSAAGAYDLAGNAAEWTASPGGSVTFWVRGGSGEEGPIGCDVRTELEAERRRTDLGVRCCKRPRRP
jgi:hypothetical protein